VSNEIRNPSFCFLNLELKYNSVEICDRDVAPLHDLSPL
jgi:hypothetical protein